MDLFIKKAHSKATFFLAFNIIFTQLVFGQLLQKKTAYDKIDSLRGHLFPERTCFDATFYHLDLEVDMDNQKIKGSVLMHFNIKETTKKIQLDAYPELKIQNIIWNQKKIKFERGKTHFYVFFPEKLAKNSAHKLQIQYESTPRKAKKAPWDGGFVWKKDDLGRPWMGVACQGDGASLWWPCKDHWSDEPEKGVKIELKVPKPLFAVANGNLIKMDTTQEKNHFIWEVKNPINLYNVNISIGHYTHFNGIYKSKVDGDALQLNYYVLDYNLEKAKKHFSVVPSMLDCFEAWGGKFPFYADGYKLVETPYLGMEHQSCIAYGNQYLMGYLGNTDYTGGHEFDYIIIHETGHEWYGNNITAKDPADMWIHEGFTTYLESIFVECQQGKEAAVAYINHHKDHVSNSAPIRGDYHVAKEGHGDMYHKGSLIINTLRHQLDQDSSWKRILQDFNKTFFHKTIHYNDVVSYFSKAFKQDLSSFFHQYVTNASIPKLVIDWDTTNPKNKIAKVTLKADALNFKLKTYYKIDGKDKSIWLEKDKTIVIPFEKTLEINSDLIYIDTIFKNR